MTDKELVEAFRKLIGEQAENWSNQEIFSYMSLYYLSYKEAQKRAGNPETQDRGFETLFQSFGTPEIVLSAFLVQLFAKYSKDIVLELLDFFKKQREDNANEQKEVSG